MKTLKSAHTQNLDRLVGFMAATQRAFTRGDLHVTLAAASFETGGDITHAEVVEAFIGAPVAIGYCKELTVDAMIASATATLRFPRDLLTADQAERLVPIESSLRDGYWQHVMACFEDIADCHHSLARVVELGPDVPYVNMEDGFTYILYSPAKKGCLLLIGNVSD